MLTKDTTSTLVLIDLQTNFLQVIPDAEAIVRRAEFLCACAKILEIPVLATEQNPDRFGATNPSLAPYLSQPAFPKMEFGAYDNPAFVRAFDALDRQHAVLVGVEAHICITQTALALIEADYDVTLAADAISSRTTAMRTIGLERLRDNGCDAAHSESIVYEWMSTADHPCFRDILALVKQFNLTA